jgi:hypothetical protein
MLKFVDSFRKILDTFVDFRPSERPYDELLAEKGSINTLQTIIIRVKMNVSTHDYYRTVF